MTMTLAATPSILGRGSAQVGPWPLNFGLARGAGLALAMMLGACAAIDDLNRPSLDAVAARMPAEIAGFQRGDAAERPGPMVVIDYATANRAAVATVQIYGDGGRPAPSDPATPEIDREVTAAVAEVTEVPHGRTGRRLAEQGRFTVPDPGLRCAVMTGAFGRAPVTRHVCIGGAQGRFVRVQVTMATSRTPSVDAVAFASGALRAVRGG